MKRLPRGSLIVAGAFSGTLSVAVPDHAVAQEGAPAGGSIKSGNESVELLRAEAERSERAVQAAIAAVHELSQVLQTEASQSAVATQRDSEAIRHAMDVFIWIVGAVSAILVAGAGILAWALSAWGKASKADIQKEVRAQTDAKITEAIAADKPRLNDMLQNHLEQTKSDITKVTSEQAKILITEAEEQLRKSIAPLHAEIQKLRDDIKDTKSSLEEIAEVIENYSDITISRVVVSEHPTESTSEDEGELERQRISDDDSSVLKALWLKPKTRRVIHNIARDSTKSDEETQRIISDLMNKGLVESVPHSLKGRPLYRLTSSGHALTNSRFGNP
jgi:DNA repair exonuclease SbcCD ATPase subunit